MFNQISHSGDSHLLKEFSQKRLATNFNFDMCAQVVELHRQVSLSTALQEASRESEEQDVIKQEELIKNADRDKPMENIDPNELIALEEQLATLMVQQGRLNKELEV